MSESLSNFLVDLASDPDRMDAFVANPAAVLDESPLTAHEKAALLAESSTGIRRALGLEEGEAAVDVMKKDTGGKPKPGGPKPGPKPGSKPKP